MTTTVTTCDGESAAAADETSAPARQRRERHLANEIDALRWQADGACRDADLGLFFSPDGDDETRVERAAERRRRLRQAIRICEQCPVRLVCRRYALENGEKFGVWGGLTETERRRIRSRAQDRQDRTEQDRTRGTGRLGEAA